MTLQFEFDRTAAARVAEYLASQGLREAAANMWLRMGEHDPYDQEAREKLGDLVFEEEQARFPLGTLERSRFLLQTMIPAAPTTKIRDAYFENLQRLLAARPKRSRPGLVVLGTGAGRCGSTTLCAALAHSPDVLSTHENPPLLFWEPHDEQVRFHFDRLRLLADYFAVVADCSHWWMNVLGPFCDAFPTGKIIGLYRDNAACARSFVKIKGTGPDSFNHWAPPGSGLWTHSPGDPLYPTYPLPSGAKNDPDGAKRAMIERYVAEYNQALHERAELFGERMLLVRTENLSQRETAERIGTFLGIPFRLPEANMNVGNADDSDKLEFRL